jgi:hypothetical protein
VTILSLLFIATRCYYFMLHCFCYVFTCQLYLPTRRLLFDVDGGRGVVRVGVVVAADVLIRLVIAAGGAQRRVDVVLLVQLGYTVDTISIQG